MAASVGAIVANIYYAQPLLPDIARAFGLSATGIGIFAMLNPAGAGLGQLLFVPLGDIRERRGMITVMILGAAAALALTASARNAAWLMASALLVGMTASINHVIIPFAAQLAPPAQRGRAVGIVISGLLIGVLVARTFSGYLGAWLGWRMVFATASVFMLVLAILLRCSLPKSQPKRSDVELAAVDRFSRPALAWITGAARSRVHQRADVRRVQRILDGRGLLRRRTTVLFHQPRRGAAQRDRSGRGFDRTVGRARRRPQRRPQQRDGRHGDPWPCRSKSCWVCWRSSRLWGLIAGVILLDLAMQVCHVTNQTRIYALVPEARSRLNMIYMTSTFTCGSLGSYMSTYWWHRSGWWGVCGFSLAIMAIALVRGWRLARHRLSQSA